MRQKIFITRLIPDETVAELARQFDVTVNPHDRALTKDELCRSVSGCDAVISLLTDTIDADVINAAGPNCRIVANYAVGFNNFDIAAATARRVVLTNTPGVLDAATATHTFALLLAAARRIPESERYLRDGKWAGWSPMLFVGADVDGATLGIAGLGRIGRSVARKAYAFNMKLIYFDVARDQALESELNAEFVDKETLLQRADFLTLHLPLLDETRHFIGPVEFKKMKRTAILINASRGPIIDEQALVAALRNGTIASAALDVFENEPELSPGLCELQNVAIVPHIASATLATRLAMRRIATDNICKVLAGKKPDACVNPEVLTALHLSS
jgi:glyoxylate reductase